VVGPIAMVIAPTAPCRHRLARVSQRAETASAKFADQLACLLQIAGLPAIAEHVGGQRHMAKLRQHPCTRHRELARFAVSAKH